MICARDGCQAYALRGEEHCFSHSQKPEVVQKRTMARSKGGSRGKIKIVNTIEAINSVEDVKKIIMETLNELRAAPTNNTVAKARAVGYLCGVALTAIEKADLEERLSKLEESLAESTS